MTQTDLEFDFLSSVFGRGLAFFLVNCDRSHPDLQRPPIKVFLEEADQIVGASRFCAENDLAAPLRLIRGSSPKSLISLGLMVRTLKASCREESRLAKSPFFFDTDLLLAQTKKTNSDAPDSFDRFRSDSEQMSAIRTKWERISSDFSSIGCSSLAEVARSIGEEGSLSEIGYPILSINRAASILCGRVKSKSSFGSKIAIRPFQSRPTPDWAFSLVDVSERAMGGFPVFDHHIVVGLESEKSDSERTERDFVVIGERDGECYFICSD